MLLIECPWCGPRDEIEFSYGGEAHRARPADPQALTDTEWAEFLFMRHNPKGAHKERWVHSHGCRRWFNVERNTVTYQINKVYPIAGSEPQAPSAATTARPHASIASAEHAPVAAAGTHASNAGAEPRAPIADAKPQADVEAATTTGTVVPTAASAKTGTN